MKGIVTGRECVTIVLSSRKNKKIMKEKAQLVKNFISSHSTSLLHLKTGCLILH